MDKPSNKILRCAIYTRKSTDHNLELEFNSLDAQREACEAYIKSQAHEGWRLIPGNYDDGAFSGASLDRPALQLLLSEVRAGKVDAIVVYKVDRLTRSLADFAKLVELFDQHSVSFVSVTQSFNTTSSMGRLTLNVLLSFAQFEREVIGERVRDKIAASKSKGIWVGGPIPLGYASNNKKLAVIPEEAKIVRLIFRRYLELGSIRDLVQDLDRKKIRTRRQTLATGKTRGGIRFGISPLVYLLRNRFYIGEVNYKGKIHPGEQAPIVDRDLFDAVQAKLAAGANARRLKLRASPSILAGRLYDDRGNRMTPTHTNKRGARYRYYVSHPILQRRNNEAGTISRVSASDIEAMVLKAARVRLEERGSVPGHDHLTDQDLVAHSVEQVILKPQAIEIRFAAPEQAEGAGKQAAFVVTVPWKPTGMAAAKGVLHTPASKTPMTTMERDALLTAIAKARAWIEDLTQGRVTSFVDIAKREGKVERHIRLLAPLAFVSPSIVADVADGVALPLGVTKFAKQLAYAWSEQRLQASHHAR
jgi:DNA invertase Pin-like site-specific DNA recombinase